MTSSTLQILIGLGLGIAAGLFLGERAAVFQFAADGLVRLRQMTVLPYVVVSLIVGIGSLDRDASAAPVPPSWRKPRWSVLRNVLHWVD